jgi:hypothetical protein
MHTVVALPTPNELRQFVRTALCNRDRLDPDSAYFFEGFVKRGERICGVFFQVEGPRLLKNHAIWVGDESRILFYDSTGSRYDEVNLSEAPDPQEWSQPTDTPSLPFQRQTLRPVRHGTIPVKG